jgi:hypothetical protein
MRVPNDLGSPGGSPFADVGPGFPLLRSMPDDFRVKPSGFVQTIAPDRQTGNADVLRLHRMKRMFENP